MKLYVYAVFDSKAVVFGHPFFCQSRGVAVRSFKDAANDSKHEFGKHSGDYTLFELGSYDDNNGKFDNLDTPYSLGLASQYVESDSNVIPMPAARSS